MPKTQEWRLQKNACIGVYKSNQKAKIQMYKGKKSILR